MTNRSVASVLSALLLAAVALAPRPAHADSVAQIDTAIYLDASTLVFLQSRAAGGGGGIQVDDELTYIIEFTPVENGSTVGGGGYLTAYIPDGLLVVGAELVRPDGAGDFSQTTPSLPGPSFTGFGSQGPGDFDSWATTNPAVLAGCGATPLADCQGVMMLHYSDTGVWYSTSPDTALFTGPDNDGVARVSNGYHVDPSAEGQLAGDLGFPGGNARTHNLWDASQTNAFGGDVPTVTPRSDTRNMGATRGNQPFGAASPMAGLDTGYQLDASGNVGPWVRIAHPGSTVGVLGQPATVRGVAGYFAEPTDAGLVVDSANPAPAGTNAIRWSVGRLNVGELQYARLRVRVASAPPADGFVLNTEVFGGDAADSAAKDTAWRYHIPSLATTRTGELAILLTPISVNGEPYTGQPIPPDAVVRYRLTYVNYSGRDHDQVNLTVDTPPETAGCPVTNFMVTSGPDVLPISPTCGGGLGSDGVFSFAQIPSLAPGEFGSVEFDLVTSSSDADVVVTRATIDSLQAPEPVHTASGLAVESDGFLTYTVTGTPTPTRAGTVVTYTIQVRNAGAGDVNDYAVRYVLPTSGVTTPEQFRYVAASDAVTGDAPMVALIVNEPPTLDPYTAEDRQELVWEFTGQTLAPGEEFTITFDATVGSDVPASPPLYFSAIGLRFDGGQLIERQDGRAAPIRVIEDLDFDLDGVPDDLDPDDDNDGILDSLESPGFLGDPGDDSDNDGVPDWADPDHVPGGCASAGAPARCTTLPASIDADGDGLPNHLDRDADGDGIPDAREAGGADDDGDGVIDGCVDTAPRDGQCDGVELTPTQTDGDRIPDYLDPDSDGDGLTDATEAHDFDNDGAADFTASANDHDLDGIDDAYDLDCAGGAPDLGCVAGGRPIQSPNGVDRDADQDGTPDWQQVCRDGYVTGAEACDDGNQENSADACSNMCLRNDGQNCTDNAQCVNSCQTITGVCEPCVNDATGPGSIDSGCTAAAPQCDIRATSRCVVCVETGLGPDDGCDDPSLPACDRRDASAPVCSACVDDTTEAIDDSCTASAPHCDDSGTPTCEPCEDSAATGLDRGCSRSASVCDESGSPHACIVCRDSDPGDGTDDGCAAGAPFCEGSGAGSRCVTCRDGSDCPNGFACNGSGACVPSTCTSDADCGAPTPACDVTTGSCEQCVNDGHCSGADVCDDNACRPCADTAAGAGLDRGCDAAAPICRGAGTASATCVPCEDSASGATVDSGCSASAPLCSGAGGSPTCATCEDTASGTQADLGCSAGAPVCNGGGTAAAECLPCLDTAPVAGQDEGCDSSTPVCDMAGGRCVECVTADQCGGGTCDTGTNTCATCVDDAPGGLRDSGCTQASPLCLGTGPAARCDRCEDTTNSGLDAGCHSGAPVCDVSGATRVCVGCLSDDDCPGVDVCALNTNRCGTVPDTDGDGLPDPIDVDDDDDGILDVVETGVDLSGDSDGDFVPDYADPDVVTCDDDDLDGVCDTLPFEIDFDGDGVPNHLDLDADGDGIPDAVEGHDADADGSADVVASGNDLDLDGLDDAFDPDCAGMPTGCAADGALATTPDFDGDTAPNFLDVDSDGDGIPDAVEGNDADQDGAADIVFSGLDVNGNGLDDALDPATGGTAVARQDTDEDGNADFLDVDADGDGIPDAIECSDAAACEDSDMDDRPDYLDIDSDDDGRPDAVEGHDADHDGVADRTPTGRDTDNDGLDDAFDPDDGGVDAPLPDTDMDTRPDWRDADDDEDGRPTLDECPANATTCPDGDGDGTPDYLDPDGALVDAGPMGRVDAGPMGRDAGPTGQGDAALPGADGSVTADGGAARTPGGVSGGALCAARPGHGGRFGLGLAVFGLAAWTLGRRRRTRRA